jgi:phospholipid/cholesterol/gamma-HCH transport system substrate-binding protein
VRYLGVNVGKVAHIMLDPKDRRRVEVIADIDENAPIDSRTTALLSLQGVTGLLFIDLEDDPNAGPAGPLPRGERYPVIRSAPSDIGVLLRRLPELANHAIELVNHMDQVFSADNVHAFKAILQNARVASERSPQMLREIEDLVADIKRASDDVDSAAADFRNVTDKSGPNLEAAIANVRRISDNLASTSDRLDDFVSRSEPGLVRFTNQSLPDLERLIRESREAAHDFRELARSLQENPSQVLYEPNNRGVKVPR